MSGGNGGSALVTGSFYPILYKAENMKQPFSSEKGHRSSDRGTKERTLIRLTDG